MSGMRRPIAITLATLLAIVAGIVSASLVSSGTASEPLPGGRDELPAGSVQTGAPVPDPHGGPPWAVRVFDADTPLRCIVTGRMDGDAFGPVDTAGHVIDTPPVARGGCADPDAEPLQVALARYADTGATGPRSVLFGVAGDDVTSVEVDAPGASGPVALDAQRTFAVVSDGLTPSGSAQVEVTLSDGSSRSYRP